jgi:spore photoproduct lyase
MALFSQIYIEKEIKDHKRVRNILAKYPSIKPIYIDKYQQIFNLSKQNFRIQKENPALILAKKYKNYFLPTPENFGIKNAENYYFSHFLNCLYDCRYCFLQGMFNSAHYVFFVNYEDYFKSLEEKINNDDKEKYFFSGYDADSLVFDSITNFAEEFIEFFKDKKNAYLEFRTKSININKFLELDPIKNIIIAFSFTPEEISSLIEHKVAKLSRRIDAMRRLAKLGWKIGVRLDPLIYHENYQKLYQKLINDLFDNFEIENLHSISIGMLRFPKDMHKKIFNLYPEEKLFTQNLQLNNKNISYGKEIEKEMLDFINMKLQNYIPTNKIFSCS